MHFAVSYRPVTTLLTPTVRGVLGHTLDSLRGVHEPWDCGLCTRVHGRLSSSFGRFVRHETGHGRVRVIVAARVPLCLK